MKMFFELKRYRECVEKSTNTTDTFLITPCNNTNNNVIPHTDNIKGKITFKNVTFMYPKGNENVLENFT
jgi:ABC-type bacteriocin/lantibiotic exporter with double-glycine peptidase domain